MRQPAEPEATKARTGLAPLRVLRTVFWSFFGVRRRSDNQDDFAGITPLQVIFAGVIGAGIFVASLLMLVRFITN